MTAFNDDVNDVNDANDWLLCWRRTKEKTKWKMEPEK